MTTLYDFTLPLIDGSEQPLSEYKGDVLLIVNTASECGFTPQYQGLESLYQKFKGNGFKVLAFPCNQFGGQDPLSGKHIQAFCEKNYGITFPLFAKVDVNGPEESPLFSHLKQQAPGVLGSRRIKWNFTKFLVDRTGKVVKRYGSVTKPSAISSDVHRLIRQG